MAGFGWKVRGSVHGYPANLVVSQSPKPGTPRVDTGAPTITLCLAQGHGAAARPAAGPLAPTERA